ncbi:MAG: hypothetical protein LC749_12850 [Actinobacteria bacterium]|nr:hypothetical protein [Actinomycetota bacterium]
MGFSILTPGPGPLRDKLADATELNVDAFIDDSHLRRVYGPAYDTDLGSTANPSRISGTDSERGRPVDDPASAGEIWLQGEESTHPAATPTCLLKFVRSAQAAGKKVRAA